MPPEPANTLPDRKRPDPIRLRVELERAANFLYRQGVGDGMAVDHAIGELDRLRAENERLTTLIRDVQSVLGTGKCNANGCEGCHWERAEAIRQLAGAFDEKLDGGS